MTSWRCGKPKKDGGACRWYTPPCPHHPDAGETPAPAPEVAAQPILADTREAPSRTAGSLQQAIDDHDLHAVAWSLLSEAVVDETKNASLISTLVRVLASLGPAPADDESVLRQIVLHGKAMWGIAPGTDNEWELAGQLFDDEALDMFRHWEATEKRLT